MGEGGATGCRDDRDVAVVEVGFGEDGWWCNKDDDVVTDVDGLVVVAIELELDGRIL